MTPFTRLDATRLVAWAWLLALVVLHLDFWRPQRPELWFGWMPEDMVYRLAWMVGAFFYLLFFTSFVWADDDEAEVVDGEGDRA